MPEGHAKPGRTYCAKCNADKNPVQFTITSTADDLLAAANRDARDLDPDLAPIIDQILHAVGGYEQGFKVQAILREWIAGRTAAPSEDAK
jgi:hypothetical protein